MSVYAQIKGGVVVNTIVLNDTSLTSQFSAGFDALIQIDNLNPMPGISWRYGGSNYSGPNFSAPVLPAPPTIPLNQQYAPSDYGQMLIDQFTALNQERGLTSTQLFTLAANLGPFYILLQCGSLQAFLDNLSSVPVDGVMITTAIITQFQTAVQAYLNGN